METNWIIPTIIVIILTVLALVYGRDAATLLKSLLRRPAPKPDADAEQAKTVTRNLAQTVEALDKSGCQSRDLLVSTQAQTAALVELVKALAGKSRDYARIAASLDQALEAVAGGDPLQIARVAGAVADSHIRSLLVVSPELVSPEYWQGAAALIATQAGAATRWQEEYSRLATGLIGEIAHIKTGLLALQANIDAAEAARPLLMARLNLGQAGRYLRISVGETTSPMRLLGPLNEYAEVQ